jgi:hypothetical protein
MLQEVLLYIVVYKHIKCLGYINVLPPMPEAREHGPNFFPHMTYIDDR